MKKSAFVSLTVLAVVLFAASAFADTISLSGGTAGMIPQGATNDFIIPGFFNNSPAQIGGYYGSAINSTVAGTLLVEFFGAEASWHNEFYLNGIKRFDHSGSPDLNIAPNLSSPLGIWSEAIGVGLIPFTFYVNNQAGSVANGSNPNDYSHGAGGSPNFFASFDPFGTTNGSGGTSGNVVYLFLDDGGAGPDDNHDDFLVRMTITPVPEPATMLLLGSGLLGLAGFARRRFKK